MIQIKSAREIEAMRKAGRIAGLALKAGGKAVAPGVTTGDVAKAVASVIRAQGAVPTFLGYREYPAPCCVSINNEVIHGIPGGRKLKEGDIVSIDVGATFEGYIGDTANTFPVGKVSERAAHLMEVTRGCFYEGLSKAIAGARISDISKAVETHARKNGMGVVRAYTGHGVGRNLHEDPAVPNVYEGTRGSRLIPGMTICIEPMINAGRDDVILLKDRWTVVTADGGLSAHYEHTVLVTAGKPELLTMAGEDNDTG